MEKIDSFNVNHLTLLPGIYESRRDFVGDQILITYDLRFTQPNAEPVMNNAEIHTIEHLAATYLRNHPDFKDRVIYFGPMGCRTGFYLILRGEDEFNVTKTLILDTMTFILNFEDEIPGMTALDCGNYLDHNLWMAKFVAKKYSEKVTVSNKKTFKYVDVIQ